MGELPQQQLNGVVVRIQEGPQPEGGSFRLFGGLAVGPSPLNHPALQQYLQSPLVDVHREYRYPNGYVSWLSCCGVSPVVSFALLYLVGTALPPGVTLLVALCALVSGCVFCITNVCYCLQVEPSPPLPLSRRELRHLVGRTGCTVSSLLLWAVGLVLNGLNAPKGGFWLTVACYVFISLAALAILVPSWAAANRLTVEPVKAGMLTSMFWTGAIFSTFLAGYFNTFLLLFWTFQDPDCNPNMPVGKEWPWEAPSGACVAKATLEWVFTPGIVEETLKFVVLLRLVTSLEDAVHSMVLTRFPRTSVIPGFPCCGWFLKLAPSPVVVVLAGMSVGAGFSTMENVMYIGKARPVVLQTGSLGPAAIRIFAASLHICMTGTCAFFLAWGIFVRKSRAVRFVGFALMVVAHGTYDAFCTFSARLPLQQCFTRVFCDSNGDCGFDRAGELARCTCHFGDVQPGSHKCDVSMIPVSANSTELPLLLSARSLMQDPFDASGSLGVALPNKVYVCPPTEDEYVCGPSIVSWWPGPWTSFALGSVIILFFAVLGCIGLPKMERGYRSRRAAVARGAAEMEVRTPAVV